MKCNKCGADFGEGLYCQHCGIDRVEGLGSFYGLHPNAEASSDQTHGSTTPGGISISRTDSMLCFSCGEIIPGEAEYCPYCKISQYVICPKCGLRYLAKYPNCYKCGTNKDDYLRQKEVEEKEREVRRKKEEESRRKADEERKAEEQRRMKEEEEERKRREAIAKERGEARRRREEENRLRKETEYRRLSDLEQTWFSTYICQHKRELIKIKHKNDRYLKSREVRVGISAVISAIIALPLLVTEYYALMLVVILFGFILCIIAGFVGSETPESFLFGKYEEANGKRATHTTSGTIFFLLETLLFKPESSSGQSDEHKRGVEGLSLEHSIIFERVFVYLQNMAVDLQNNDSDFATHNINYKLSCLEWEISIKTITDPQVSNVVDVIIKDRDYWDQPDCLKSMNLRNEVLKIINSINV